MKSNNSFVYDLFRTFAGDMLLKNELESICYMVRSVYTTSVALGEYYVWLMSYY